VTLGKNGVIRDIEVAEKSSENKAFISAAIAAVKKWEYEPGKKDGQPVDLRMTLKFEFLMQ
jgi:TonB family protein